MAKTIVNYNLGPAGTPQEVKDLRESAYDFHNELGSPVMFKHRWNADDAAKGLTWKCPLHDELYGDRDAEWDHICFGTGYVGGYADGELIFVTIQDTLETQIKVTQQGILTMDMHPPMEAPWLPKMGDGDLIITVDFDPNSWQVTDEYERYVLRDVTPVTMRGPGWGRSSATTNKRHRISQKSALDKLPVGHPLYEVPFVFDYSQVPDDPTPPYQPEPGDEAYTEVSYQARIHGVEDITPDDPDFGTVASIVINVRIQGTSADPGTHVFID